MATAAKEIHQIITIAGLVLGATGIAVLWAAGQAFPVYPPPGIIILGAGAVVVGLARWRWVPLIAVALGLFIIVGALVSPDGLSNLAGRSGPAIAAGQAIQGIGVLVALVAGILATRAGYRTTATHTMAAARS